MGIDVRVEAPKVRAPSKHADDVEKAAKGIADPTGTGTQCQVSGFTNAAVARGALRCGGTGHAK